jgi:hypothetical protein
LNEVGVVTNASLLSAEFLEHLSDSLSKNLVRLFKLSFYLRQLRCSNKRGQSLPG